jgi:hypothetical protein
MKQSDTKNLTNLYENIHYHSESDDESNLGRHPLSIRFEPSVVEFLQQNFKPDQYPNNEMLMKFSDALRHIRSGPDVFDLKKSFIRQAALYYLGNELGNLYLEFEMKRLRDSMRYTKVKKS